MTRDLLLFIAFLLMPLFSSMNCSEKASFSQDSLSNCLPDEADLRGWKKDGSSQEYRGEDLFLYINGGAEIYHEYGFKQVIVQDFLSRNKKSISLEIFEMESTASAYGIYTFKTHPGGKTLSLGDEAQLADYYLNFWKGNFLVTLTGLDEDKETVEGLKEIARAVDRKIKVGGKRPSLVSVLSEKDLIPSSIKYLRGNLGLYNAYPFFTENIFALKEAVKGDYQAGHSLYIVRYESGEECQRRFSESKIKFRESPRYKDFNSVDENLFQVEDRKGRLIFVSNLENYMVIVVGAKSQAQAGEILAAILQRSIKNT